MIDPTRPQDGQSALRSVLDELQSTIDAQQQQMREIADALAIPKHLSEVMAGWSQELNRLRDEAAGWFERLAPEISSIASAVAEVIRELPHSTRRDLKVLARHGWYLDPDLPMSAPGKIADAIAEGQVADANEALVEYFRDRKAGIRDRLVATFPHRREFIEDALDAHDAGKYTLSVPVFLSQADGICVERTGGHLFIAEAKRPQTAAYVDGVPDEYMAALLSPLAETHPISVSARDRPRDFDGLNRHQVLHGESLSYHTEANSLKALSLLSYLTWVLEADIARKERVPGSPKA